jgi:hypothetical protein
VAHLASLYSTLHSGTRSRRSGLQVLEDWANSDVQALLARHQVCGRVGHDSFGSSRASGYDFFIPDFLHSLVSPVVPGGLSYFWVGWNLGINGYSSGFPSEEAYMSALQHSKGKENFDQIVKVNLR